MDESLFEEAGIKLEYMDYSGYPEYPQQHPPFDHAVTILAAGRAHVQEGGDVKPLTTR